MCWENISHFPNFGYKEQHWQGSFADYLAIVEENPMVVRSAHQRLHDMVLSYGVEEVEIDRDKITHYKFFDDPIDNGEDGLYGLDRSLMSLMKVNLMIFDYIQNEPHIYLVNSYQYI